MLPQRSYAAVPSGPSTPRMTSSPPLTGNSLKHQKQPFMADQEPWPTTPVPKEIVQTSLKLKKRIRVMRVFHRVCLTILAICATALEGQMLYTFLNTKNTERGGRGPWAKKTSLWPSILLLSSSATTALVGLLVLASYARSIRAANHLAMLNATIIIVTELAGFITWIVVAILYRTGKTGKDLWGWACSPLALRIQPQFAGIVDFPGICKRGETNWGLSIASAGTNILSLMVWYFVFQRRKYQKIQQKIQEEDTMRIEAVQGRP